MVSIACLVANMQQTLEQYSCSWSREPTHWMKAMLLGVGAVGRALDLADGRAATR